VTSSTGAPVEPGERALALDALRGIALFGVLMVNLLTIFRVSLFQQFVPTTGGHGSAADQLVARVLVVGFEWKAFTLFSLLFGVGLAAQYERVRGRGIAFATYIARRLGFLLVLGLAHLFLVWNGDVLTLYAVIGALAAPLLRLPVRVLLALGVALLVVHVLPLPFPTPFASAEALQAHVAEANRVYGFGTFGEALAFRVREVRPIAALLLWTAPRTLGLFLLGASAWRAGLFRGEHPLLLRATSVLGLVFGGGVVWAESSGAVDFRAWREVASRWGAIGLAFGYGATVLVAFERASLARALALFAPVGRMALTSYVTQSIVLGALFYGWGLGLFGRLGEAKAALIGVALFGVQLAVSALWLRRYRFGPIEWLWRSFTYGAAPSIRR
jgi:uncharacterized protein